VNNSTAAAAAVTIPSMTNAKSWKTLLHLWNDWYRDYYFNSKHYLMIRFEDLLWHPRSVVEAIRDCVGAVYKGPLFVHVVDQSKWEHVREYGPQSNLISAMIKHGSRQRRIRGMTRADLEVAAAVLDDELLRIFQYQRP
jgi:hypothetical protein